MNKLSICTYEQCSNIRWADKREHWPWIKLDQVKYCIIEYRLNVSFWLRRIKMHLVWEISGTGTRTGWSMDSGAAAPGSWWCEHFHFGRGDWWRLLLPFKLLWNSVNFNVSPEIIKSTAGLRYNIVKFQFQKTNKFEGNIQTPYQSF